MYVSDKFLMGNCSWRTSLELFHSYYCNVSSFTAIL